MADLVLRSRRVLTPHGLGPASLHVRAGRIERLGDYLEEGLDYGDLVLLPGVVDSHVHINEPGRTHWEGFRTLTRAAAAGGVTTLVDMPLNSIPATTNPEALEAKRTAARGQCWVDVGFWGGAVPGNAGQLAQLHEQGVLGFKGFLAPSGVDEFPPLAEADLRQAMAVLARLGAVLLLHAELPGPLEKAPRPSNPRSYQGYLASRPDEAEVAAIELVLRLSEETGCRVHIVHLATSEALPLLAEARRRGRLTVETCPHYLALCAEEVPDGATAFKCAPPIRAACHRDGLWQGLARGVIDLVASDHSPSPPELKGLEAGDFMAAWGGISSLQIALPVVWTEARRRGFDLSHLGRWMAEAPARLAGLTGRKGQLAPGCDADVVVFDPEATFTVEAARLHHRHPLTPYEGRLLSGVVRATWLRGQKIYDQGELVAEPQGELLARPLVERV
jgi:allantoinase